MKNFLFLLIIIAIFTGVENASANSEIIKINGVNLSVKEAGKGQPMILIHGRGYSKEYMDSLFDYYKNKFHVFSYDTRGHGLSDKPKSFTLDDDVEDLVNLINFYNLKSPVIVGFSMGSYITLKAAEKYPELFSKIVLIGTRGKGDRYADEDTASMNENEIAILNALIGFDNITEINKVKIPALVITGELDKINPVSEGKKVADALNNAKFEIIPNAPHVAFMKEDERKLVFSLIDKFLSETILTYSDHEPLGNMRTKFLNDVFFKSIEEQSQGRVKINPHWNSEISISYEALKTVKDGSKAQITVIVPEYCMKELPLHQLFKSFPIGPTGQEQVNFFKGIYKEIPELLQEIEAQNLHIIFIATGYPVAFFSSKPMPDLKAIKGQKWRSASFWHKDFLTNAGATPITMAWGQGVFEALNDGTLDGLMVNVDSGYDINAHKAAPNILTSQKLWLGHEYIIAMNKSAWEKLSASDKKSKLGEVMNAEYFNQLEILRADGADVRILSDEEIKFWENTTNYKAIQDKWVKEQEQTIISTEKVLILIRNYMRKFFRF